MQARVRIKKLTNNKTNFIVVTELNILDKLFWLCLLTAISRVADKPKP